jgi:hypothetical protein
VVRSSSSSESHVQVQIHVLTIICSPSSDVSDRYNNLKAAWDNLMEAAEHASPQGFYVAVMVVLERLKKEELRRKSANQRNEATFASSSRRSAPCRPSFVILDSCVVNKGTCMNVCNAKYFHANGNTL